MDYRILGQRIRARRRKAGLTQERLAELAGISTSFLGHVERGTRILSVETLLNLCRALNTTADDLLGPFSGQPLPPEWPPERCAAVLNLLEDASRIVQAMKS